jgi:dipeptidyl aminopeptidase/acylaminoacyl peptidase
VVAAGALRLGSVVLEGDDIYWLEGRPEEAGRNVVVKRSADGSTADVTPPGSNVRSRVHEYGGAAYTVSHGTVYYSEFGDQRLYRLRPGGVPEALTPAGNWFYADAQVDGKRDRLVCVREDHSSRAPEAVTTLVSLPLSAGPAPADVIVAGHDFYSTPRFSPDGSRLCWVAWRHPQMPWDGTELWVAEVAPNGSLGTAACVAGGPTESIFQPGWSPDGELFFTSDRSGWWNLYRLRGNRIEPVCSLAAEFGRPLWTLGTATWAFVGNSRILAACAERGLWRLVLIDAVSGATTRLPTDLEPTDTIAATRTHGVLVAGSPSSPDTVVRVDLSTGGVEAIRAASTLGVKPGFLSAPVVIEFPTDGGLTAYLFYYAPQSPEFAGTPGEKPPLIVVSHGGPTAAAHSRLNLEIQYWTSRGFAVADVNYGGSSGYGRAYRERLRGQWGIVDVADCVNGANYLVAAGKADANRLIIRGRSAGGYTTLAALVFRPDVFRAGASYYGVADLELLARETHKFESRYLEGLIGAYPEARSLYYDRSPVHFVDRLSCPIILFQGAEDQVVPPGQARLMREAAHRRGLPVALVVYEGEQHGFRRADTIVHCLEAELFFYGAVFGFTPAGIRPVFQIENLDGWKGAARIGGPRASQESEGRSGG